MIQVTRRSPFSGKLHTMELPISQEMLDIYEGGKVLLQNAFPMLTRAEREFIKTGITPSEWKKMLPEEEEE